MTTLAVGPIPGGVPVWTLQDRLKKARETAGLSQYELADRSGISRGSVSNYETGATRPRIPQLNAWADACDVSREWLAGDDLGVRRTERRKGDRRQPPGGAVPITAGGECAVRDSNPEPAGLELAA